MASTASASLKLEQMATGEQDNAWGDKMVTNLQILEAAIGRQTVVTTASGTATLADVDYTLDAAKYGVIRVTSALSGNLTVVVPTVQRYYICSNESTNAYTVTFKQSAQTGLAVTQGSAALIYFSGSSAAFFVTPEVVRTTGAPTTSTSSIAASGVTVSPTGNLASTNAQAALAELQGDIDTINTALPAGYQPLDDDLTVIAGLASTKGNIITGGGADWDVTAVGTNGQLLMGASAAAAGVSWVATPAKGTLLAGASGSAWATLDAGTNGYVPVAKSSATNGIAWSALIPSGTTMSFAQSAAPTGWSKVSTISGTTVNQSALRVVSGTTGGDLTHSGRANFTTVFASQSVAGTNSGTAITEAQMPAHTHVLGNPGDGVYRAAGGGNLTGGGGNAFTLLEETDSTGGDATHTHTFTGTAIDMAVRYIDVHIASKDAY